MRPGIFHLVHQNNHRYETGTITTGSVLETVKKKRSKSRNPFLADEDLVYEPGKEDALLSRLAAKMNHCQEEVKQFIEALAQCADIASQSFLQLYFPVAAIPCNASTALISPKKLSSPSLFFTGVMDFLRVRSSGAVLQPESNCNRPEELGMQCRSGQCSAITVYYS